MSTLPVQTQTFILIGSGATAGSTTFPLQSFKDILGVNLSMSSFGSVGYGTLEPDTTNEDSITFTGITQNSDGTATLTGVNSVGFLSPYTASSGLRVSHAGSVPFIITNTSAFTATYANKNNAETITQNWSVPDPVGNTDIANKEYVLSVVNGGAVTTSNVVVPGTAGETIATGNFVYLKTDGAWWKTTGSTAGTVNSVQLGIAQGAGTAGNAITGGVLIEGLDTNQSGLVAGTAYFLQNTAGTIGTSAGTTSKVIGQGKTATTLYFNPNYTYIPTAAQSTIISQLTSLTGTISPYAGRSAPSGYLLCDGTAVSRTTYASLLAIIAPSKTFTVTLASPGVFTSVAHGLVAGDSISLTTTGALPTGLATATQYFVLSAGLTADAFEVALSPGGTAVNTSGTQSGVHTFYATAWGYGDGSTTFNVPDLRSKFPLGLGQGTETLKWEAGAVDTGNDWITIPNYTFPSQGQAVVLTTTGALPTGLSLATTYYIVRLTSTTIGFATSQSNANSATLINLMGAGSGVGTMTYTNVSGTIMGHMGGEENHGISIGELATHTHVPDNMNSANASGGVTKAPPADSLTATPLNWTMSTAGSDSVHNNQVPFARVNFVIKT